jgi:hypothetical protein
MYFVRSPSECHPADPPPFLFGFTTIRDHLRAEEVLPGCDPQSRVVPVRIPISCWSQALAECGGWVNWALSPAGQDSWHCTFLGKFQANSKHTKQIPGEVILDLVNARSKTDRTPVLDCPPVSRFN